MLLNATFSMLSYRRFIQSNKLDIDVVPNLDICLEVALGLCLGIVGSVLDWTSGMKEIALPTVNADISKTYEKFNNQNRHYSLRNLQRSRGGSIFSLDSRFPDA